MPNFELAINEIIKHQKQEHRDEQYRRDHTEAHRSRS